MFKHIRTKFVIILLITGLLPLLIGTTIYLTTSKNERAAEKEHGLLQELSHVSFAIESIFLKAQTNLLLAAVNPAFFRYFTEDSRQTDLEYEQVKTLRQLQLLFPEAISVTAFIDVSGNEVTKVVVKQISSKENLSTIIDAPFFVPGLSQPPGGVYQGEPYLNRETKHWVIPFVAPVHDQGTIMGLLYFDLNLEYFSEKLKWNLSSGNHAFLLERGGKILAQTIIAIGETAGLPNISYLDQSPLFHKILGNILNGDNGAERFTTTKGRDYLVSYQPVPSSLWSVMVLTPYGESFRNILPLDQFLLIFLVTFVLIIIFTFYIGKKFSDPVKDVVTGTQIIASGDFTHRIKTNLHDELGDLAKSFNKMAEYLQKTYQDLKSTSAQLTQSAKLAAVGELAAGVAHELNQPLMVIRGHAQELLEEDSVPEKITKDLKLIEKQTGRMMRIIDHLRAFARQSSGAFEPVNLNEVIYDSFTLISQQLKNNNIVIVEELDDTIPRIWGDQNKLEQVFLNLMTNSKDAMEEMGHGILTVKTQPVFDNLSNVTGKVSGVLVLFSDTGVGIGKDIIDKVFDPFFTTKEVGKGTGLGLSISYSILKDHGGSITAVSNEGAGITFRLEFPAERRRSPRKKNSRDKKTSTSDN
ncbi:MAG TPA: ATP-binding protein [Nitrospirota bacterium]|nr:ATP-binding protein [Nitrospirota bacterium]